MNGNLEAGGDRSRDCAARRREECAYHCGRNKREKEKDFSDLIVCASRFVYKGSVRWNGSLSRDGKKIVEHGWTQLFLDFSIARRRLIPRSEFSPSDGPTFAAEDQPYTESSP